MAAIELKCVGDFDTWQEAAFAASDRLARIKNEIEKVDPADLEANRRLVSLIYSLVN
jgi:hypothetical protein